MQIIKYAARLLVFLCPSVSLAQTTYLQTGAKENVLLERLEIKQLVSPVTYNLMNKPFSRRHIVAYVNSGEKKHTSRDPVSWQAWLSKVDRYNLQQLLMNNAEWIGLPEEGYSGFKSKKPLLKSFYKTRSAFFEVNTPGFSMVVNPLFQLQQSVESGNSERIFLNARGITVRGMIGKKIGFNTYLTENQERAPLFVQKWITQNSAVPGAGFFKPFKGTGTDYFDARGYITFNAAKYVDFQFGYDRNFIGSGYRSLFLSDFGNSNLFFKINTRVWKFNYQNLFMELQPGFVPGGDKLLPRKYAAMHHLNVSVTRWLNIGLFEGVIFGRQNRYDFSYLVPVIFYRSLEQQNGSFDNSLAGIDFKANIKKRVQVYGQFLLDEFILSEIRSNTGSWANKWGLQLGAKYIDALGIKNLDLQLETNRVRPFTYAHRDSTANYTHYNQPLAHPLGANFQEFVGIARYQPAPRWMVMAKAIYFRQGLDSNARSFGSNIFLPNVPPFRQGDLGYKVGGGLRATGLNLSASVSYELKENLFLDLAALYRKYAVADKPVLSNTTKMFTAGIRVNLARREYDY